MRYDNHNCSDKSASQSVSVYFHWVATSAVGIQPWPSTKFFPFLEADMNSPSIRDWMFHRTWTCSWKCSVPSLNDCRSLLKTMALRPPWSARWEMRTGRCTGWRRGTVFQIVMLNSLSDLHGYVDKGQLTGELGGSLEYCHSQWIHHRTVSPSAACFALSFGAGGLTRIFSLRP